MSESNLKLQLPKSWPSKTRSAMVHIVSLVKYARARNLPGDPAARNDLAMLTVAPAALRFVVVAVALYAEPDAKSTEIVGKVVHIAERRENDLIRRQTARQMPTMGPRGHRRADLAPRVAFG